MTDQAAAAAPSAVNGTSNTTNPQVIESTAPTTTSTTSPTTTELPTQTPPTKTSHDGSSSSTTKAPPTSIDLKIPSASCDFDENRPKDFKGEVQTSNEIPGPDLLRKIENYVVLDRDGRTHTFRSLYSGPNVARRVLVIFVRHFFCGNCQEYLRTLAESITTDALLSLPVSTFITVIGCGDPRLIESYVRATDCPFPLYTDPKGQLFSALGMVKTLNLGEKPAYMKKSVLSGAITSIGQGLKQVTAGLALKSGDQRQVGGEFLFEPYDLATPINTPQGEGSPRSEEKRQLNMDAGLLGEGTTSSRQEGQVDGSVEEKKVSWCHRMKTTRDHAEIPELMEILGLAGHGKPAQDAELWKKALQTRKGTGSSLAEEMGKISSARE